MNYPQCSDNYGCGPSPCDLPIPEELKQEWKRLETRRHLLGRSGNALGWAAMASLLGGGLPGGQRATAAARAGAEGDENGLSGLVGSAAVRKNEAAHAW